MPLFEKSNVFYTFFYEFYHWGISLIAHTLLQNYNDFNPNLTLETTPDIDPIFG